MAPKKKKKAINNPNRGFTTTSQPSKARLVESDHEIDASLNSDNDSKTRTPNPDDTNVLQPNQTVEQSLQDMTPEALELHLEDAELQNILDRHGARCRAESKQQVSRLRAERRQSRALATTMHPEDWLDHQLFEWAQSQVSQPSGNAVRPLTEGANDERLVLDLWVLHRVLTALMLPGPEHALSYVINLSITQGLKPQSSLIYGLQEAFEYYTLNFDQADLSCFKSQDPPRAVEVFPRRDSQRVQQGVKSPSSETARVIIESSSSVEMNRPVQEGDMDSSGATSSSDDDNDDDPAQLADRWISLQTRLWTKKRDQENARVAVQNKHLRRIVDKIASIENDILFEKDAAEPRWFAVRNDLERDAAVGRAAAKANTNGSPDIQPPSYCSETDTQDVHESDYQGAKNDLDATELMNSMFDEQDVSAADFGEASNISVRDFGKYTGLSPYILLKQVAQVIDGRSTVNHRPLQQTTYSARHQLQCHWSKARVPDSYAVSALPDGVSVAIQPTHWQVDMNSTATTSASSSIDYASAIMLFLVMSLPEQDEKVAKRLPTVWVRLLTDLEEQRLKLQQSHEKATIRQVRQLIDAAKEAANNSPVQNNVPQSYSKATISTTHRHARPAPRPLDSGAACLTWTSRSSRPAFQKMSAFRSQLPIYIQKDRILQTISENPVVILCAETGSGKSTQAGSYILEDQLGAGNDCHILVTQPRRISAISLARRVSQEIGEGRADLGTSRSLVGYAIRLESRTSEATRLTFATTGVLLRMLESSPTLDQLDYLILDEVHERGMEMDLAFIALRKLRVLRPSLKIILMSATVNALQFSRYFDNAPVLDIEGRTYPVTVKYLEDAIEITNGMKGVAVGPTDDVENDFETDEHSSDPGKDQNALKGYSLQTIRRLNELDQYKINYELIVNLATAIATKDDLISYSKAILIFMPGIAEIRRLNNALLSCATFAAQWDIHMLHSSFSTEDLERAFVVPPPGRRKVVIATNIAETGITIPDVTAVIDTCKEKIMRFDERRQLSRLIEGFTARSSAKQRRGRAARVQPGLCFHLVTKHRHDNLFLEQQVPEMLRLSLQDSIMKIKVWDPEASIEQTFAAAIDPPTTKNVNRAIERLKEAGALDTTEHLTPLGESVARLPLDVSLAKLAILGTIFGCLEPILTIISLQTSKSIFSQSGNSKAAFARGASDQLSALNAYESWRRACVAGQGTQFARKHHLVNLSEVEEVKVQLFVYLVDGGLVELSEQEKRALSNARVRNSRQVVYQLPERYDQAVTDDLILSLLATSFYPRALMREGKGYRNIFSNQQVTPGRGSVIREMSKPPQWLSFAEAMRTKANSSIAVQEASRIPELALSLLLGSDVDFNLFSGVLTIDGRIRLSVTDWKQLLAIKILRRQLRSLLNRRYRSTRQSAQEDDLLITKLRAVGSNS